MIQKNLLLVLAVSMFSLFAQGQVSVTATVGTTGPTSYTTLKSAFDAVNAGTHKGVISISVTANTTETLSASLNASGSGSASYTSISISPSGGSSRIISGNIAGDMFAFNGSDNVTIDGLNAGGNTLTIQNINTGAAASVLYFNNEATNNIVKNCFIKGSSTPTVSSGSLLESTSTRGVITFGATSSSLGNSNNTIQGCDIGPYSTSLPWCLVYSYGNASYVNQNVVANNTMYDFHYGFSPSSPEISRSSAVYLSNNSSAWTITGNTIYQSASRALSLYARIAPIYIKSGQSYTITNNSIGGAASDNSGTMTYTGSGWSFSAIETTGLGTSGKTMISGNTVKNISFTTNIDQNYSTSSRPRFTGILSDNGYFSFNNNNIGSTNVDASISPSISITASGSTYSNFIGMIWNYLVGGGVVIDSICGNQIGGIKINSSNLGNTNSPSFFASGIVVYYDKISKIENNTIGSLTSANNIYLTGSSPTSCFGFHGIRTYGSNASSPAISVSGNIVSNVNLYVTGTLTAGIGYLSGIEYSLASDAIVSKNTVQNLTTNYGTYTTNGYNGEVYGIKITSNTGATTLDFSGNKVSQLTSSVNSVTGINVFVGGTGVPKTISRNFVSQISAGYNVTGIYVYNSAANTVIADVQNNIVSLSSSISQTINGIQTFGAVNNYFNTCYLFGSAPANTNTYAMSCYSYDATKPLNVKNNIFYNNRTRTSGASYNCGLWLYTGTVGSTLNYNNYYTPNTGGAVGVLTSAATVYATLSSFKSATSQDVNSLNATPSFINPVGTLSEHFIPTALGLNGVTGTGVTTDYYNVTRNASSPTIGALDYSKLWKGDVDNDWNNASNWAPSIPISTDQVTFSEVASNNLNLDQDRTCGSINFNSSNKKVVLGANNITPGIAYYPTSTSYIQTNATGVVNSTISNGGYYLFAVGNSSYNPVTITNNSGSQDAFTVSALDEVYQNGASGSAINWAHIKRTWDITKSNPNSSPGIDLMFNWNNGEVAGNLVTPSLYHYENSAWAKQTGTTSYTSNSLTYTGYTGSFSPFAIGDNTIALPVTFTSLSAISDGKLNRVYWSTATEENNRGFEIQRSIDGVNFIKIGFVNTLSLNGNSNTSLNYTFVDYDPIGIKQFYRLKQIDFDSTSRYSGIVVVSRSIPQVAISNNIYPNPTSSLVHLNLSAPVSESMLLTVIDVNGRVVVRKYFKVSIGNNSIELDASTFEKGVYFLSLEDSSGLKLVNKFVKQ